MVTEKGIRKYVDKCFTDAFCAEGREICPYTFEYVLVKNTDGVFQMFSIIKCKYDRVRRRVEYRLANNLKKNFGIHYGNTENLRGELDDFDGFIDLNYGKAMFTSNGKLFWLQLFDSRFNPYEEGKTGECMISYIVEKLLFKYWGLDTDIYRTLPENDERRHIPSEYLHDWNLFSQLYLDTFENKAGSEYEIVYSSGLTRL